MSMPQRVKSASNPSKWSINDDEDEDDLFASAVSSASVNLKKEEDVMTVTSGYSTARDEGMTTVVHSDTLEDISVSNDVTLDEEGYIFEPEPEKSPRENGVSSADDGGHIPLVLDDEDEKPFQDAHLKPQLQLSGGGRGGVRAGDGNSFHPADPSSSVEVGRPTSGTVSIRNSLRDAEESDDFLEIKVTSPHKVGEGISSYMAYKVHTRTNVNYFRQKEMSVDRRFSDFLGLHDKLTAKYLQNGRIIPPAPDKSLVGMTKIKMAKEGNNDYVEHSEFVERRRAALERFLNRSANHPSLRTDPDFREFLELEAELPKASQTATLSGRNVMKLISKVGDSISNMTLKLEETDDWFEEKTHAIDQLETQLRKFHYATEALVEHRKALSVQTLNVSKALAILSGSEDNSALSGAIAQLSTVQEKISGVHSDQAGAEFYHLSEIIKDYIGLVGAVKDAFHERVKAWQAWQSATQNVAKKREAKVRAELQQRPDKVALLRQEIADMERQQDMAQENFERISRLIKKEVEMFDVKKAEDFKKGMMDYLEAMVSAQERISFEWESYVPEIQRVNVG